MLPRKHSHVDRPYAAIVALKAETKRVDDSFIRPPSLKLDLIKPPFGLSFAGGAGSVNERIEIARPFCLQSWK